MRLVVPLAVGDPAEVEATEAGPVAGAPTSRPLPTPEQAVQEGSLLLLVEDHPVNRTVLVHQLETIGFRTETATDGQDGLERFREGRHALVLTDLNMPRMDGFDLARAIRAEEDAAGAGRTPIIALTASVMQGEPERAREAGMDDFAAKPTTIPFLAGKLRRWLPALDWTAPATDDRRPAPLTGAAPAAGPIDPSVLDELTGGDAELAADVLAEFLVTTRDDVETLRGFLDARDVAEVRARAHRVRGAGRAVGAQALADVAQQLESLAALGSDEWPRFAELVDDLERMLDEVVAAVEG